MFWVGPRIETFLVGASEIVGVGGEIVEHEFVVAGVFVAEAEIVLGVGFLKLGQFVAFEAGVDGEGVEIFAGGWGEGEVPSEP